MDGQYTEAHDIRIWTRNDQEQIRLWQERDSKTRDRLIASPTRWPLGHAASSNAAVKSLKIYMP